MHDRENASRGDGCRCPGGRFGRAFGAEPEAAEHRDVVLEVAPAGEWGLGNDGKTSFGPSFALAVTPI
jgi:hypothetical protein